MFLWPRGGLVPNVVVCFLVLLRVCFGCSPELVVLCVSILLCVVLGGLFLSVVAHLRPLGLLFVVFGYVVWIWLLVQLCAV